MERRTFTREFELEAVKLTQERGMTVAQAARDLGVQGSVLRRWVQESVSRSLPSSARTARSISFASSISRQTRRICFSPSISSP
jgi:transposase-like protein